MMSPYELHKSKISTDANAKYIWNRLISSGLSPIITAGIMGNMYEESQFKHNAIDSGGKYKGLVQMSPFLYSFYTKYLDKNKLTDSVESQLNYLIPIFTERNNHNPHGLEGQHIYRNEWGGSGRQDKFLNGNYATSGDAARAFAKIFERNSADTNDRRAEYANIIYNIFKDEPLETKEPRKPFESIPILNKSFDRPIISINKKIGLLGGK